MSEQDTSPVEGVNINIASIHALLKWSGFPSCEVIAPT